LCLHKNLPFIAEVLSIHIKTRATPACLYCADDTQKLVVHDMRVVPRSHASDTFLLDDEANCCLECDKIIENFDGVKIEDRAAYIAEVIAERFKNILTTGQFSSEEMLEMDVRLRTYIESNVHEKKHILGRLTRCHLLSGFSADAQLSTSLDGSQAVNKRAAYLIVSMFLGYKGNEVEFIDSVSQKTGDPIHLIKQLLGEKIHIDVVLQLKYDLGLPLGSSLRKLRKALVTQ
jgi:hypothetical protein